MKKGSAKGWDQHQGEEWQALSLVSKTRNVDSTQARGVQASKQTRS